MKRLCFLLLLAIMSPALLASESSETSPAPFTIKVEQPAKSFEIVSLTSPHLKHKNPGHQGTFSALQFFTTSENSSNAATVTFTGTQPDGTQTQLATVRVYPKHTEAGLYLSWEQSLDFISPRLYWECNAPVVSMSHVINPTNFEENDLHVKVYSGTHSKAGIGDISLSLGYSLIDTEKYWLSAVINTIIPTKMMPYSKYVSEAHYYADTGWNESIGLTGKATLYATGNNEIYGAANVNYRHQFPYTEERTLGLKHHEFDFSHYLKASHYDLPITPVKSALTTPIKVSGGSNVNVSGGLGYRHKDLVFECAYECKGIMSKEIDLSPQSPLSENSELPIHYTDGTPLTRKNLDFGTAATRGKIKHKLLGDVGCTLHYDDTIPVILGAGASYTFKEKYSSQGGWEFHTKIGVSF